MLILVKILIRSWPGSSASRVQKAWFTLVDFMRVSFVKYKITRYYARVALQTIFYLEVAMNHPFISYFERMINSPRTSHFLCEIKDALIARAAIVYRRYNFSIYKYYNKTSRYRFKYFLQMSANIWRCFSDQIFHFHE